VKKLTALWASNAPWAPTGYGTQTMQVTTRMVADGHNVAVASNYGLEATVTDYEGMTVYPKGLDPYSNEVVYPYWQEHSREFPDGKPIVFTLYDAWVFDHPRWDDMPVVCWVPIDHTPAPEKVMKFLTKPNVRPLAMSQFGAQQIRAQGLDCDYIPHAIDTQVFKPSHNILTGNGVKSGRQIMKAPKDAFVVGINNNNKGIAPVRKSFAEQLLAFSIFAADKPDAFLYLHTERHGGMGGIPFDPLIKAVGLRDDQFEFVNQYQYHKGIPSEYLAVIYSGMDVLLAPTLGEGFGITVIDAQSCGVPVIVSDFSAQPELVGHGWKVPGQPLWDVAQGAWFQTPSVSSIVDALNQAYEQRTGKPSEVARQFVVDNYDADKVYAQQWRPLLSDLAKD